jgi:hypothetical protein
MNVRPNGSGGEAVILGSFNETIMASSSLSASTAITVTNNNFKGLTAYMRITSAFPGSASTTYALKVYAVPVTGGSNILIGGATPRSASGVSSVTVYPGITVSAGVNAQVSMALPRDLSIVASLSTGATSKEDIMSLAMTWIP